MWMTCEKKPNFSRGTYRNGLPWMWVLGGWRPTCEQCVMGPCILGNSLLGAKVGV